MSRAAKTQPSLSFPARKKPDRSASKQQQRAGKAKPTAAKKSPSTPSTAPPSSKASQRSEDVIDVQAPDVSSSSRSSPRSAPIVRTASNERHIRDSQTAGRRSATLSLSACSRSASHPPLLPVFVLAVRASVLPGTWTDASDNELLLRRFDLDYAYGPCGGLSRRERWQRAKQLGLDPPQSVLDILSQLGDDADAEGSSVVYDDDVSTEVVPEDAGRRRKRRKYDVDSHSIFENVTARILEAEGRVPP